MHADPVVHARRWKTLGVLSLSLLIIGLDNTVLNVALPTLQTHFAASGSTLQWIVDAYLLAFAGVLLTMGTLGDRFGRKRALQSGLVMFGIASVLAAFAQNAEQLIVLRAAMGIGGAMIMPATLSVIMDVFPREERAKAIGIWSAIAGVGIGLGPFVGGLLLEWFSVERGLLAQRADHRRGAVRRACARPREPRPEAGRVRPRRRRPVGRHAEHARLRDHRGHAARLDRPARARRLRRRGGCSARCSSCGSAASRRRCCRCASSRDPRFTVASVGVGLVFFALMGSVFAFTQFLQFAHGYSALEAGAAMLPLALGLVIGSGALDQARRARRAHPRDRRRAGRRRRGAQHQPAVDAGDGAVLLALVTFGLALSMGAAMAPATDVGHERRAGGQGRRRLGDERRHAPGRRRSGRRRDRLAHRHRLLATT